MNLATRKLMKWGAIGIVWPVYVRKLRSRPGMSLAKFATSHLSKGDTVIDIGANDGDTSRIFSLCVGASGAVHAVEPNSSLHELIRQGQQFGQYKNVHIHPFAISDASGEAEFLIDTRLSQTASTLSREHAAREIALHGAVYTPMKVQCVTLDSFAANLAPKFIKIDVEGAEEGVVLGGLVVIAKHRPTIWFEFWGGTVNGETIHKRTRHIESLRTLGYELFIATVFSIDDRWIAQDDPENLRDLQPFDLEAMSRGPMMGIDLVAIPPALT